MQPVPRSFQAQRTVLDEAWPAQPPGSPRYDPKQNFRLPLELEILTNRRCALTNQHKRKTVDLRFPYDRPWRQGFPYVFGIVKGEVSVAAVGLSEKKCLATVYRRAFWTDARW